jgi:hypothetical protein
MQIEYLLDNLWKQYTKESPESEKIYNLFIESGEVVTNDHIAFRTFDDSRINVEALGNIFTQLGYEKRGEYRFEIKKLYAKHYQHSTNCNLPKIFISELETNKFSIYLQDIVKCIIDKIPNQLLNSAELLYSGTLWGELDYDIYQNLLKESEYAAWLYAFGFRANHFTIFVNKLNTYNTIEKVNHFIKQNGFTLNNSGGEIKGTPQELLEQSSTMANKVKLRFKQGEFEVLNSYYEFARRYQDNQGNLYNGFIAKSADKIFESTNIYK